MHKVTVTIGKKDVKIPVAAQLSDVTLGGFQIFMRKAAEIQQLNDTIEELALEIMLASEGQQSTVDLSKSEDLELELAEYNLLIADAQKEQIRVLVPEKYQGYVNHIPISNYPSILACVDLQGESNPLITFDFLPACTPDIEYYTNLRKNKLERQELKISVAEIKHRLKSLKKGTFVSVSVADAAFESRIATDRIRKNWKQLPTEFQEVLDKKKLQYADLRQEINSMDSDTPEQRREKLNREKLLNSYEALSELQIWEDAHRLISHTVIPLNERYSYTMAEKRAEYFKKLPLDKAKALVLFFSEARKLSIKNLQTSSRRVSTAAGIR